MRAIQEYMATIPCTMSTHSPVSGKLVGDMVTVSVGLDVELSLGSRQKTTLDVFTGLVGDRVTVSSPSVDLDAELSLGSREKTTLDAFTGLETSKKDKFGGGVARGTMVGMV